MKKVKFSRHQRGIYYLSPRIIRFESYEDISKADIESLFIGAFRLLRASVKREVEREYQEKLARANRELERYKK